MRRAFRRGAAPLAGAVLLAGAAAAQTADTTNAAPPAVEPDSTMVGTEADSTAAAVADSAAAAAAARYYPSATIRELGSFRVDWSVNAQRVPFGEPNDPDSPPAMHSLADVIRLEPGVRTREMSQGPTAQSFELRGTGTGRSEMLYSGGALTVPGTSGPHTNEVFLSAIDGVTLVRGGAAAIYGPGAAGGALLVDPRQPVNTELLSRVVAEEGVDGYQRGAFQASRHLGTRGRFFASAVSRRIDGFFPGTKQVDRQFTGLVAGELPAGLEGSFQYRRYEGDGRFNGFSPDSIGSIVAKRGDYFAKVFRKTGEGTGALFEAGLVRERLENIVDSVATRDIRSPSLRVTSDLPGWFSGEWAARVEASHWRIEDDGPAGTDEFFRGAAALRYTRRLGERFRFTESMRFDAEEDRTSAWHVRWEGAWEAESWTAHVVTSRNAHVPPRGSEGSMNEIHHSSELGVRWTAARVSAGVVGFGSLIDDVRPDPTFEDIRARRAAVGAPLGDATNYGATVDVDLAPVSIPVLSLLGETRIRTSYTWLHTELDETGAPLPGRPKRTWTGEGFLQRRLFEGELLARVRGRLTHYGDRVDAGGEPVIDMWHTDVILEGEIGDAVVFYRFHDLLERADELEPGIRFPGFSRMYGVSWRFWG